MYVHNKPTISCTQQSSEIVLVFYFTINYIQTCSFVNTSMWSTYWIETIPNELCIKIYQLLLIYEDHRKVLTAIFGRMPPFQLFTYEATYVYIKMTLFTQCTTTKIAKPVVSEHCVALTFVSAQRAHSSCISADVKCYTFLVQTWYKQT